MLYVIIHCPLFTSGTASRTVIISALVCANACVRARLPLFQPDPWSCDHQKWSSHASSCGYQVSRDRGGRMLAPGISAGFLSPINISRLILQLAATGRIWQRSCVSVSGVWKLPSAEGEGEIRPLDFLISEALSGRQFNYDWYCCVRVSLCACVSIEYQWQWGGVCAAASVWWAYGGHPVFQLISSRMEVNWAPFWAALINWIKKKKKSWLSIRPDLIPLWEHFMGD